MSESETITVLNTPHETHKCGCGASITLPLVRPSTTWPSFRQPLGEPAPVVPFTPPHVSSPNTLVLLDDKTVLLALSGTTQERLYELTAYLNDDYPEFRWVVLGVEGGTRVADLRGDPDLTAKAQALWDRARADLTPG